jgi:hypothetical protein
MGSAPTPPPAPDPTVVAQQQTDTNVGTALANSDLGNVNQTDQFGDSITFGQQGTKPISIDGQTFNIPQVTENTQLGPAEQQLFNTTQGVQQTLANDAGTLANQAGKSLNTPPNLQNVNLQNLTGLSAPDLSAANIAKYTNSSFEQPFDNLAAQQQEQLNQSLASQGIMPGGNNGTAPANGLGGTGNAYNNAQMNLGQEQQGMQDTFDQAMFGQASSNIEAQNATQNANLEAENQSFNTNAINQAGFNNQVAETQSTQPLNELASMLGLGQVNPATFQQTNQPTIPTTDTAQIAQNSFEDQQQNFNTQEQQFEANQGGLFGTAGTVLGGLIKGPTTAGGGLFGLL